MTEEHLLSSYSSHAPISSKDLTFVLVSSMAVTVRTESFPMATEGLCELIAVPLLVEACENLYSQGDSQWRPQWDLFLFDF